MGTSCCATACWTMRSTAVGMPSSLTFPLSLLGISTRLTGSGRYLPLSILSVSASWLASSQAGSSATPMPSTPPAPPFLTTRSHAACMFSREQMRSSRSSVLPTCIASSSSSSVLHASVGASGYSRGSAPALPGWPSNSIRSCLPSSARMVFLSDSLRLGSALPRGRPRVLWPLLTPHGSLLLRAARRRCPSPGRPAPLRSFPAREASRGKTHTFPLVRLPHLRPRHPCSYWASACLAASPAASA